MVRYNGKHRENTYCCLEDTLVTPIGFSRLADLVFARLGVHYTVLASDLVTVAGTERALLLLIAAEFTLELRLDGVHLALLDSAAAVDSPVRVVGKEFELVADAAVQALGLGDDAFKLLAGRTAVGLGERPLVQGCDGLNIVGERADLVAEEVNATEELLLRQYLRLLRVILQFVRLWPPTIVRRGCCCVVFRTDLVIAISLLSRRALLVRVVRHSWDRCGKIRVAGVNGTRDSSRMKSRLWVQDRESGLEVAK